MHVIEQDDGRWRCAHGRTLNDLHDRLPDAIAHLRKVAKISQPAIASIHWADGRVDNVGAIRERTHPRRVGRAWTGCLTTPRRNLGVPRRRRLWPLAHRVASPGPLSIVTSVSGHPALERSLSVERTDRDDSVLLVLRGDLDLATEGQLLAAAWAVLRQRAGRPVVLDLSRVQFGASIGYSELAMISHEATSSGQEVRIVAGGNRRLRHLLGQLGSLPIHDAVDDAYPSRPAACRSLPAPLPAQPPGKVNRLGA